MVKVQDIADYFIWLANYTGSFISNLKLQKLVYYAQAWYLAIHDKPLFDEDLEAWIHGPVIPELYKEYCGFKWKPILKEVEEPKFTEEVKQFLDEVADVYFGLDAYELEQMTRSEAPWIEARGYLPTDASCNEIISKESMREYFKPRVEEEEDSAA